MTTRALSRPTLGRRQFLGALSVGASIATTAGIATVARADSETVDEKRGPRYRESDHVKTFYRVNRYPS